MTDQKSVERDQRIAELRRELQDLTNEKNRVETAPILTRFREMQKILPWMK